MWIKTKLKYISSGMQPTQMEKLVAIEERMEDAVCSQKTLLLNQAIFIYARNYIFSSQVISITRKQILFFAQFCDKYPLEFVEK